MTNEHTPLDIGPLPLDCLSEWIDADPEAFQERVKQFAYAQAMERAK